MIGGSKITNEAIQRRTIKVLTAAQILNGVGVTGTVAAGSLLVSSISHSESLAGLAQTTAVLGNGATVGKVNPTRWPEVGAFNWLFCGCLRFNFCYFGRGSPQSISHAFGNLLRRRGFGIGLSGSVCRH